ncbi:hairy-related 1 [Amia ocellicauda]|uniref:hairy-related 1 n=1 Tax=Amia ocellicauda TaxID=2972642 RepID=UPI003464AE8E
MPDAGDPDFKGLQRMLKPLVEKRRRERINHSLEELRTVLLSCTKDQRFQNPRLEKAEILELTVEYLEMKRKKRSRSERKSTETADAAAVPPLAQTQTPEAPPSYELGFQRCVSRVTHYLHAVAPPHLELLTQGLQQRWGVWAPPSAPLADTCSCCHCWGAAPEPSPPPSPTCSPTYSYSFIYPPVLSSLSPPQPCPFSSLFPSPPLSSSSSSSSSWTPFSTPPPSLPASVSPSEAHHPQRSQSSEFLGTGAGSVWRPWS